MNLNDGTHLDYCTQLDASGSGRERCAGACFASVLLSAGWDSNPWELTVAISDQFGWTDKGATSDQIIAAASDPAYQLQAFKWYGWNEALSHLDAGHAVLCLLDNWLLYPRRYPNGAGWNAQHWVRLVGVGNGNISALVYDPLVYPYQGPDVYTVSSLRAAIAATPYPEAGVVLWKD